MESDIDIDALLRQTQHLTEPVDNGKKDSIRFKLKEVDPDTLWISDPDSLTFMYHDGKLITGPYMQHYKLAEKNKIFLDRDDLIEKGYLLGRVGIKFNVNIVAFWNDTRKPEVKDCIKQLLSRGDIKDNYYIVGDNSDVVTVSEFLGVQNVVSHVKTAKYSPELLRMMHTLPPAEKGKIMANQGYKGKTSSGFPGVKWWANQSESFKEWLKNNDSEVV